eukprot:scaffold2873_cov55-Phaeocystis_antarctica.AAC.4
MDLIFRDQNVPASDQHEGLLWCRHTSEVEGPHRRALQGSRETFLTLIRVPRYPRPWKVSSGKSVVSQSEWGVFIRRDTGVLRE